MELEVVTFNSRIKGINWRTSGGVNGLRARGGFEIESLEWKNGQISQLVIKSNLGGACRIRSCTKLKAEGKTPLRMADGENRNALYATPQIKKPLISETAALKSVNFKDTFLYDIKTQPGKTYVF